MYKQIIQFIHSRSKVVADIPIDMDNMYEQSSCRYTHRYG